VPAYTKRQQIIDDIAARIEDGTYPPGHKLPSAAQLREQYGVSQQTVRDAMTWLKATGAVVGVPGSGLFVAQRRGRRR
jgi:DNA-binding GntR family transcriptional regulator